MTKESKHYVPDTIEMVREFHLACEVPLPIEPRIPGDPALEFFDAVEHLEAARHKFRQLALAGCRVSLRMALETEELAELGHALGAGDIAEALDAQVDRRYIADGTTLELGLAGVFGEAFARVHAANMAKVVDGKVIKDAAGKIRKPDGWTASDLSDLVKR